MYSQQEYDMVRRQTMQIEAEKRAVLRLALIAATVLLAASLLAMGWMYRRYSSADSEIKAAEAKATDLENKLQQTSRELAEKKAIVDKNTAALQKQNATIETIVPKMLSKTARESELAELAHAVYQMPGRSINLPAIPPDKALRRYRIRVDGRPYSYMLGAGQVDGKWVLYSNLVKNQEN